MNSLFFRLILAGLVGAILGYYSVHHLAGSQNNLLVVSHALVAMFCVALIGALQKNNAKDTAAKPAKKKSRSKSSGRESGQVKWFNGGKGFGFITYGDEEEIFVHFRSLRQGSKRLLPGKNVEFSIGEGKKGAEAEDVVVLD